MYSFEIDCPNEGLGRVMQALNSEGIVTESRNGPVIRFPKPVCLEYPNPRRRWLDHPLRAANHFFHLYETIWMLAGSELVAPLNLYNSGMKQYSDDGVKFAAPYGYRWRKHFGFDQLKVAVQKLIENPADRRIVIQMWDPRELAKKEGKDFACNQQILLDTRPLSSHPATKYALDMTVTNRSNDLIYGAMGSNLVHFSLLHEWLAAQSQLELGTYYQISKNMHLYTENEVSKKCWDARKDFGEFPSRAADPSLTEYYAPLNMEPYEKFIGPTLDVGLLESNGYLGQVALPVCEAYRVYKMKDINGLVTPLEDRVAFAISVLSNCKSDPLREACESWFMRVLENSKKKAK